MKSLRKRRVMQGILLSILAGVVMVACDGAPEAADGRSG